MLNKFKLIEVKSSGDFFIEGLVSTPDPDDYNDVVTTSAQVSIDNQLKNFDITMDLEHEEWIDPVTGIRHERKQDKIPVALIVDSKVTENGTFVRAMLNKAHPMFDNILQSIKKGFLHSFSIAYDVTKREIRNIGKKTFRFIEDLVISNIGITGNPVNKKATFKIALKSISKKMAEENKLADLEIQVKELKSQVENTEKFEALEKEVAELKAANEAMTKRLKAEEESDDEKKEDKEMKSKAELKSLTESYDKKFEAQANEIKELKSVLEKVRKTPIQGAQLKSQQETATLSDISMAGLMVNNN